MSDTEDTRTTEKGKTGTTTETGVVMSWEMTS